MRSLTWIRAGTLALAVVSSGPTQRAFAHEGLHDRIERVNLEIEQHPTEARLFVERAELHRQSASWAPALEDLARASGLTNADTELELVRGRLMFDMRWYESARKALERFLQRNPNHVVAHEANSRVFEALGEFQMAAESWTQAIRLSRVALPEMYVARANCVSKTGADRTSEALAGLEEGFRKLGRITSLHLCALDIELAAGQHDAALARIEELLVVATRKDLWLAKRGDVLSAAGRAVEARRAYEDSLRAISRLLPKRRRARATLDRIKYLRYPFVRTFSGSITAMQTRRSFSMLLLLTALSNSLVAQDTLVSFGEDWHYLDDGSDQGNEWTAPRFDHSMWDMGPAQLGYGGNGEVTSVNFGSNPGDKFRTTYFRREFPVGDHTAYVSMDLRVVRDDGVVVYLNGTLIARINMPGTHDYLSFASSTIGSEAESTPEILYLSSTALVTGPNVLAVEVHQRSASSSDLSFDLQLTADTGLAVKRGPYLQQGGPDQVTVRWRTNIASDQRVRFGSGPGSLTSLVDVPGASTDHEVMLTGLSPDTTYFYSIGTTTQVLAGDDAEHFFLTSPPAGTAKDTRVWVIGDAGTGLSAQREVRDAYYNFTGATHTDLWLMLGDNAYVTGTDSQYQVAVFETYHELLRKSVVWPTRGNHEASEATYHGLFSFPTLGEVGGLSSGTEAYYSFDYANVHFVCLDSQGSNRAVGAAMWNWAQADLAATNQKWIVAYWHHPPYTRGSHNSDTESNLVEMRQNFNPMLEVGGVDLVLNGHSHSYERSFLLSGHYGVSASLTPDMVYDSGDGSPSGDGAYRQLQGPGAGTVYAVAGSSGKTSGGPLDHAAMFVSLQRLVSVVLDIDEDSIDVRAIDEFGATLDSFRIEEASLGFCNGDGGDQLGCTDCPCMNNAPIGTIGGCLNSASTSARLIGSGNAAVTQSPGATNDLRFGLTGAPASVLAVLTSGDSLAPTGAGHPCFDSDSGIPAVHFDGLRCAVINTRRHGGRATDSNGDVGETNNPWGGEGAPTNGIAQVAGFMNGQTRYFQVIYRDDPMLGCLRALNTSQALEIQLTP